MSHVDDQVLDDEYYAKEWGNGNCPACGGNLDQSGRVGTRTPKRKSIVVRCTSKAAYK